MPTSLALLGHSDDALALVRAAAEDARFEFVAWCEAAPAADRILEAAPHAMRVDDWQSLALDNLADAVIVAPPDELQAELREEQLRRLAQIGVPLLLLQPACTAILALELDMIRSDTGGILLPYSPGHRHPALLELAELFQPARQSAIGAVEQVLLERHVCDRGRRTVLAHLARDAAILRQVAGPASNVSAGGGSADGASLGSLTVNLRTVTGVPARWSAVPSEGATEDATKDDSEATLTLVGERGRATLFMPRDTCRWRLERSAGESRTRGDFDYDPMAAVLDEFAAAIRQPPPASDWPDACRDLEVVATVEESLRRGRALPIYEQRPSEEQTFKGLMSVGGCGVLLVLMALTLIWAVIEGVRLAQLRNDHPTFSEGSQEPDRQSQQRQPPGTPLLLRLWPVYPLAAFLLLQLLRLVFRRPASAHGKPPASKGVPRGP